MKKGTIIISLIFLVTSGLVLAQQAKIVTEALTPHRLEQLGLETNISSGLDVVGNETYVYLSAENVGNTEDITSAIFEIISKPASSAATTENVNNPLWAQFKPDIRGAYTVKLTISTASGSSETTKTIYAAEYVGVGNFSGVDADYPNCMVCHENWPQFVEIFDRWQNSGHATRFMRTVNGTGTISEGMLRSFTTGYNPDASNNGFDDVAESLGWELPGTAGPGTWDSLITYFSSLSQLATIGCESCHGPGGEHARGTDPNKIAISLDAGNCGQCHDHLPRQNEFAQWESTLHSDPVFTGSFAQGSSSQNNSLANCIRCHGGDGFVNFTKNQTTNTTGMTADMLQAISCAVCHDPHGNENVAQIRSAPEGSDTLANGMEYSGYGTGELCMNCHKARRDNVVFAASKVTSSHWGPHYSGQTDTFLGENAAMFDDVPYKTSPHKFAVANACVTCHMSETPEDEENVNTVGGHTWRLHNEETGYYHTASCTGCHGEKESWDSFIADIDYDGDGQAESIPDEFDGLVTNLRIALPPFGIDSVSWEMIRDSNDVTINKAYYNYLLVAYEGSKGMHNTQFSFDVLRKTTQALGGTVTDVKDDAVNNQPVSFALHQNYPNPFNPSTTIRYSLPFDSNVKIAVYSINGELVSLIENSFKNEGTYEIKFNMNSSNRQLASGIYFYSIEAKQLDDGPTYKETKKMILMK